MPRRQRRRHSHESPDLFSGIGGFALAASLMGWNTVAFCEIDKFCQQVLRKHWPDVPIYEDVTKLTYTAAARSPMRPGFLHDKRLFTRCSVDVVTGGFPCQDISVGHTHKPAKGIDGERSGLWSECVRITDEVRPQCVVFENVAALRTRGLGRCLQDLWSIGYDAEWYIIPAAAVGADHLRERIWLIAYPAGSRVAGLWPEGFQITQPLEEEILSSRDSDGQWKVEPDFHRVADGVPDRLDRLKAIGNAIVPQVATLIFEQLIHSYVLDEPAQ